MKAAQIDQYGAAGTVVVRDVTEPIAGSGQVLVKVLAASLNPFDSTFRSGAVQNSMPVDLPVTLGGDLAGTVAKVGSEVSGFSPGDIVYGQANVVAGNSGAFAEYAVTKSSQLAHAPSNLTPQQAAAMPLIGVSALQAITIHLDIKPGQRLFINGGGGGIGSIAIQIAKHLGAFVATTATGADIELTKRYGADQVVNYRTETFHEILSGFDALFDTVGNTFEQSLRILKPGGKAVSMVASAPADVATSYGVTAITQGTQVTTERLDELRNLIETGIVSPHLGATYPLERISDAFEARESGSVHGKIVIETSI